MITDKVRLTVIEINTNIVKARNVVAKGVKVGGNLTGPSVLQFSVSQYEKNNSCQGIEWGRFRYWVIAEMAFNGVQRIVAATMVWDAKIDPQSGDMALECHGFSDYARGIPWLENWNDIAVDPFDIVQRIYAHLQSFPNANLGIDVLPASSGTLMLPGYGQANGIFVIDFFALFTRAIDFTDCGDYVTALARDIPFDYIEEAQWNSNRTEITKTLRMSYPTAGVVQQYRRFVLGENVISAELADETDIQPVTDVIIRGYLPGKVVSSTLANADENQARRTVLEEDSRINSRERAAALAKRKLVRRNPPTHFAKIIIDPDHSHAEFGTFDVGDRIYVRGEYPWIGEVAEWHRIVGWVYDEDTRQVELSLKAEGAFNYDEIDYDPDYEDEPTVDLNRLSNGYFMNNLSGWSAARGTWLRNASMGYATDGCVRIDCNDDGELFRSHKFDVTPGEHLDISAAVRWKDMDFKVPTGNIFEVRLQTYLSGAIINTITIAGTNSRLADRTWLPMRNASWTVPGGIDQAAMELYVNGDTVDGGTAFWDDAKVLPV